MKKILILGVIFLAVASTRADVPASIKPVSVGLGGFSYWSAAPWANTMLSGAEMVGVLERLGIAG